MSIFICKRCSGGTKSNTQYNSMKNVKCVNCGNILNICKDNIAAIFSIRDNKLVDILGGEENDKALPFRKS